MATRAGGRKGRRLVTHQAGVAHNEPPAGLQRRRRRVLAVAHSSFDVGDGARKSRRGEGESSFRHHPRDDGDVETTRSHRRVLFEQPTRDHLSDLEDAQTTKVIVLEWSGDEQVTRVVQIGEVRHVRILKFVRLESAE